MSGKDNIIADTLSRLPPHENNTSVTGESREEEVRITPGFLFDSINAVQPGLDYQAMASAQTDDPDVQASASRMSLSPTGPSRYFAMYPLASRDQFFPKPGAD